MTETKWNLFLNAFTFHHLYCLVSDEITEAGYNKIHDTQWIHVSYLVISGGIMQYIWCLIANLPYKIASDPLDNVQMIKWYQSALIGYVGQNLMNK